MPSRRHAPATQRNRGPILEVLRRVLPPAGTLLEIASGSGEHAVHFAAALPDLTFVPSDVDPGALGSIQAWIAETGVGNVRIPIRLDVTEDPWPVDAVDAIFSANMVHISPPETTPALVAGAARHLVPDGVLVVYGPFRIGGAHTAPSNASFDADLRARPALGRARLRVGQAAGRAPRPAVRRADRNAGQQPDFGFSESVALTRGGSCRVPLASGWHAMCVRDRT